MTVTADYIVVDLSTPDMTREAWIASLVNTPAAVDANESYDRIWKHRVSHAFCRAVFRHESTDGQFGITAEYDTKSPGNTRTTRIGKGTPIHPPGRGQFMKYDTWADGWEDLAFRIVDPTFVYVKEGRRTIAQIIERWAPSSDGNVPASYIAAVVRDMNEWVTIKEGESPVALTDTIRDRIAERGVEVHDIRESMIWHESKTYQRLPNTAWRYVGVHHTGVHREPRTLDKEIGSWVNHSVFHVNTRGWPGIAYAIGISLSGRVFILRDLDLMGYHAFDANENTLAIAGDLTTGDAITPEFERSLFTVLDVIHEAPELPNITSRADTYGHKELKFVDSDNAGTECPGDVLRLVQAYRDGADVPDAGERKFDETGFSIRGRIRDFWERAESANVGYQGIGLPLSEEYEYEHDGRIGVRQDFERTSLFYEADKPFPWDVTALPVRVHREGLVGVALLKSVADELAIIEKQLRNAIEGDD